MTISRNLPHSCKAWSISSKYRGLSNNSEGLNKSSTALLQLGGLKITMFLYNQIKKKRITNLATWEDEITFRLSQLELEAPIASLVLFGRLSDGNGTSIVLLSGSFFDSSLESCLAF